MVRCLKFSNLIANLTAKIGPSLAVSPPKNYVSSPSLLAVTQTHNTKRRDRTQNKETQQNIENSKRKLSA